MVELRDYQQDLLAQVQSALTDSSARVMLQLPTGGGKTHAAGALLLDWLQDGRKAVWLTHRRELATQTEKMLSDNGVSATCNISWTPGDLAPSITNGVVILMAQTVSRRTARDDVWQRYDSNDLLIVDEAHHAAAEGWARAIRQWPGPVLGMTATPWRLSEQEGFDHLFSNLVSGPQVRELQSENWLCPARVIAPPEESQIVGGKVDLTGDYSETGIEQANNERPDILTAGALRFWQEHGDNRQTVIYAVSVRHAQNLVAVFYKAGIPARLLLSDTPSSAREWLLEQFKTGNIRVLINVAVATEGFDLPDAACIMLTRPTMSLSLYLQMVGRGLRPKPGNGDCVVLDLAGNCQRHGLPEQERQWSLAPRGRQDEEGGPLVVRCPNCEGLSPAASHYCIHCSASFGETCNRCGRWRAWETWSIKHEHDSQHDPVCDLCHYDAHIQAELPVTEEMMDLADLQDANVLPPDRNPFLKDFLEEELRRFTVDTDVRKDELHRLIRTREFEMADDDVLSRLFAVYLTGLPDSEQPKSLPQTSRRYTEWEGNQRRELAAWRDELAGLESQSIDGQLVLESAKQRLMKLLQLEATEVGLLPEHGSREHSPSQTVALPSGNNNSGTDGWMTLTDLEKWGRLDPTGKATISPVTLLVSDAKEVPVRNWADLLSKVSDWLVQEGLLTESDCPVEVGRMRSRYLINEEPVHPTNAKFRAPHRLSNGLYLENHYQGKQIARFCAPLVKQFDQDPEQFHVLLR